MNTPNDTSLRAQLRNPLVRVALHTAGPVVVMYFAAVVVAFLAGGIAWWAAAPLALGPTSLVALMAVLGFRHVARQCSRCGQWAELVDDGAGQQLCGRCWLVIAGPPADGSH